MIKDLCRCGHLIKMHMNGIFGLRQYEMACFGYKINSSCKCLEYIPKDNLEYLEQLYDKKKVQNG